MAEAAARSVAVALKIDIRDYVAGLGVASKATKDFASQAGRTAGSAAKSTKDLGAAAAQSSTGLDSATKSTKAFGEQTRKTQEDVEKTKKSTQDAGAAAGQLGAGMAVAGAALAAGIGLAVKAFADFDKEMSNVKAVSGATAGEMDRLTQAALDAGAATVFSSSQAAEAEAELVKAGISVNDVLGGALQGTLDLAAAGSIDLGNAATVAANAMNIFGLEGKDVGHIADVLAAGANKSAADVDDLGQALQQSGLVASQFGLSLEETVGLLAAFADNGLKGSDAGTSLKTMMQRLVPQSKEAATAMKDIGFSAFDASGNMKKIDVVAADLQKGLTGLTDKQRNATLATIFGSDAVRGATIAFKLGKAGVDEYTQGVTDAGAASRVAKDRLDNLSGDLENLRGSFETALIKGGSGANDALRGLAKAATVAVNSFSELPDSVQSSVIQLAGLASGALLVGGGLLTAIPKIVAMRKALDDLTVASPRAAGALGALGKAGLIVGIAAAGTEVKNLAAAATVAQPPVDQLAEGLSDLADNAQESADFATIFNRGVGIFSKNFDNAADALDDFGANSRIALDPSVLEQYFGNADQASTVFNARIGQLDKALVKMVQEGKADKAAAAVARLETAAQNAGLAAGRVSDELTGYKAAVDGAAVANGQFADSTGKVGDAASDASGSGKLLSDEIDDQKKAAEDAKKAYDDLTNAVKSYGDQLSAALSASSAYEAAIDKAADVATKRKEIQDQINELTSAGSSKGSINAKFDKDDAKTQADFAERIKNATTETEKSKLRTQLADQLAESKTRRKSELDDNAKQITKLRESQKQYAATLDDSTEAGRNNGAMLRDIAQTAKDAAVENFKNGVSYEDVKKKFDGGRDTFIKQAEAFGATRDEAVKLADGLGLTEDNLKRLQDAKATVTVAADTAQANTDINFTKSLLKSTNGTQATATVDADTGKADGHILQTDGLLDALDGRIVTPIISLDMSRVGPSLEGLQGLVNGTMGPRGFAEGGYTGDGGKFEPKGVVHGGEFVFTKEETAKAGVVNLKALARSLRGYAAGGYVTPQFADRGMVSSAVSNTYGGSVTNDRRISIENLHAADFASFEREADRRSRLHALGRRGAK